MKKTALLILIVCLMCLSGCTTEKQSFLFGTIVSVRLEGGKAYKARDAIFGMLEDYERTLSPDIEGSDVYRINHSEANTPVQVSDVTLFLLREAKRVFVESGGAFNPAMRALSELWGFPGGLTRVPAKEEIDGILPYCSMDYVVIDEVKSVVTRLSEYTKIDLGGIAKGYFADKSYETACEHGVGRAVLNIGGNIYMAGSGTIAISHPRADGEFFGLLRVSDVSVVTSGDYERYFEAEGKRYHHILAPDGYPSRSGLVSVTVIGKNSTVCDALATAVMVLGEECGEELMRNYPDLMFITVSEQKTCSVWNDKGIFELSDESYSVTYRK